MKMTFPPLILLLPPLHLHPLLYLFLPQSRIHLLPLPRLPLLNPEKLFDSKLQYERLFSVRGLCLLSGTVRKLALLPELVKKQPRIEARGLRDTGAIDYTQYPEWK